jgi:hypothetical protein
MNGQAYGNVGLSMGYPGMNYSLTGAMSGLSKVLPELLASPPACSCIAMSSLS